MSGPAVYRLFDRHGQVLYIGMTGVSARKRIGQHLQKPWGEAIHHCQITPYGSRAAALQAEQIAIRSESPMWNVDRCLTLQERRDQWSEDDWRQWLRAIRATMSERDRRDPNGLYRSAVADFRSVYGRARTFRPVGRPTSFRQMEYIEIAEYDPMATEEFSDAAS